MVLLMWGFILLLAVAVIFLIALHFRKEQDSSEDLQPYLQEKVVLLEGNLKKTLEIMQDLVKSVHHERETLKQAVQKVNQLETQQAELLALLTKYVGHAEDLKQYTQPQTAESLQNSPLK